jgi:hypothetical protein
MESLEILLLGVWLLGIGWFLRRERTALGVLTLIIGGFAMLDALAWIIQVEVIFRGSSDLSMVRAGSVGSASVGGEHDS